MEELLNGVTCGIVVAGIVSCDEEELKCLSSQNKKY